MSEIIVGRFVRKFREGMKDSPSLRTALRWGQAHGFVRAVPAFHLPMVEKAGRVLTDQEISAIYEALPANARGPFVFALNTGVRRGELLALRWERVRKATGKLK